MATDNAIESNEKASPEVTAELDPIRIEQNEATAGESSTAHTNILDLLNDSSKFAVLKEYGYWPPELDYLDNRYCIRDNTGQRILYAGETANERRCFPLMYRPFILLLFDSHYNIVGAVERKWTSSLCFWGGECGGNEISVVLGTGPDTEESLGWIEQHTERFACRKTPLSTYLIIDNDSGEILGAVQWSNDDRKQKLAEVQPRAPVPDFGIDMELVNSRTGDVLETDLIVQPIGFGDSELIARDIGMRVPSDLSPRFKALLLGLLLSIYITYYDRAGLVMLGPWRRFQYKGRLGCVGYKIVCWALLIVFLFILPTVLIVAFMFTR